MASPFASSSHLRRLSGVQLVSLLVALCGTLVPTAPLAVAASGDVVPGFDPALGGNTFTSAIQPDGKILFRSATIINGAQREVVRVHPDGSLDTGYLVDPAIGSFYANALQADGKLVLLPASLSTRLIRLNPNGTTDTEFNSASFRFLRSITVQPDGKLLIAGRADNATATHVIARLHTDGTLDTAFAPVLNGSPGEVLATAVQRDGRIIIVGGFTGVNGVARNNVARLLPNGSLDTTFNPNVTGSVYQVTALPDGKILIGSGGMTAVGGVARNGLARLHPDGRLDTTFVSATLSPNGFDWNWVPQADGKLIVVYGVDLPNGIARLHQNGSLDTTFTASANGGISYAFIEADGRVIIVGGFTLVNGIARSREARLQNDPATQGLVVCDSTRVQWLRGGTSPEVGHVWFELSTDGGIRWIPLGSGTRIAGGWELNGLALPQSGLLRARARTIIGRYFGGSGIVETVTAFGAGESFRITRVVFEGGNLQVSFPSGVDRRYTLWQSDSTAEGTWTDTGLPALNGTGAILTFSAPVAIPGRRYFRVRAGP